MGFFDNSTWGDKEGKLRTLPQCGKCGLYKNAISPKMKPTGSGKRKILVVGEAPGETEDREGVQFVGKSGVELRKWFKKCRADLEDCTITNAVICRPPDNKMDKLYIACCQPNLTNTITELKPNVIILLGATAAKSLIDLEWKNAVNPKSYSQWVGWNIPSPMFGAWLCPTYHPSYILRSDGNVVLENSVLDHIRTALAYEHVTPKYLNQDELSGTVEVIPDPKQMRLRLRDLASKKGRLSIDYETTGLKPERKEQEIYTAAFYYDRRDCFSGKIDESCYDELSRVLLNDKLRKTGANIKFEERWTLCKLGHGIAGWVWDVCVGMHVIDNRPNITSVKFQTYIKFGIGDYGAFVAPYLNAENPNDLNRIKDASLNDVLRYGGLDTIVEDKLADYQQELMYGHVIE